MVQTLFIYEKEKEINITENVFNTYIPFKEKLPKNEINHEIDLISKIIKRPYKVVAGLTRHWTLEELRNSRIQAEKANISSDKAWWAIRKRKKL